MKPRALVFAISFALLSAGPFAVAQDTASTAIGPSTSASSSSVPRLVRFSGTAKDLDGKPLTGIVGITFLLYADQQGGSPLWLETQNVQPDSSGRYSVQLGATKPDGLPSDLFTSVEARWLGVQISGQAEQPRVLLLSVPYALKAGDAETVGGLPPSAFVLANSAQGNGANTKNTTATASSATAKNTPPPANPNVTGKGVVDYIPMWDTTSDIVDSVIFQKTSEIGIGTTAPAATLDVNGKADVRDTLTLFPKGTDSTLAINGTTFKVDQTGKVTFITGQTFPGAGTITGITTAAGSGLSGGGTKGTLTLKVPAAGITNAMLQKSTITLNANTAGGLTTPGAMTLGSTYTISLKPCTANQILQYSGTVWNCGNAGTGTVTSVGLAAPVSDFVVTGSPVTSTGTLNLAWNVAPTYAEVANAIVKRDGSANVGVNVLYATDVNAGDTSPSATTIFGQATSLTGEAWGVEGETLSSASNAFGVFGNAPASTGYPIAVYGQAANSSTGIGVFGQNQSESTNGANFYAHVYASAGVGAWGDGGPTTGNVGVVGTADDGYGGLFVSSGVSYSALAAYASNANGGIFYAINSASNGCSIDGSGNINCTGAKNAVVPIDGGKRIVAMSAIEAPQNWFEDAGEAEMLNGSAVVNLDYDYTQTVNTGLKYQVFLTPYGDCKGLYVSNRTATSFEVHELGGGKANLNFGYRIMALRKNYEKVRFADHTHDMDAMKIMRERAKTGAGHPVSHDPVRKPGLSPTALTNSIHR